MKNNYNEEFEDIMSTINNIAVGYGFTNGLEWAKNAYSAGEITYEQYKNHERSHSLRNSYSHGGAKDICISRETYMNAYYSLNSIRESRVRNYRENKRRVDAPRLPEGTFRSDYYIKEFSRTGYDGENYYFKFAIKYEVNDCPTQYGFRESLGYYIHIIDAPYFKFAKDNGHDFHIISSGNYDAYICWDKNINSFEDANAIMYVWTNRYANVIDEFKRNNKIFEYDVIKKADRKNILPAGTFRSSKNRRKIKTIHMFENVYDEIMNKLGKEKPELGGMLGGRSSSYTTITKYVFDEKADVGYAEYSPNIKYLQSILDYNWSRNGIDLIGFVHSHPGSFRKLSSADVSYAMRIIDAFDLEYLFMPIVTSSYDYKPSMIGYVVYRDGFVDECKIDILEGSFDELIESEVECNCSNLPKGFISEIENEFDRMSDNIQSNKPSTESINDIFSRISNEIDINYMSECSIIGIGCGGARSFYESMARMGVGNFYLMDGDKSSYSNIASQNGYISEVGLYKPELIKNRILEINPNASVICFNEMLRDELDDKYIEDNIISKIDKDKTLICAFTDNFFAQARASRIALKYGIPFICAQHHSKGETSEVIFWYPKVTKYSLREIAKSRYNAYENGYINDVTSVGSPIFNTTRLNALCEKIAFGMLLYGKYPNHVYCSFLNLRNDRNLILIRQCTLTNSSAFYELFDNSPDGLFDDVIWVNPETFEDLSNVELEEKNIEDTRNIFNN